MKKISSIALILLAAVNAGAEISKFFANNEIQRQKPAAFALQPESQNFIQSLEAGTRAERDALVAAIQADSHLSAAIANWKSLSIDEQIPYLKEVFRLEVQILNITAPELIIDNHTTPGAAFFDFDLQKPGPGRVILNSDELAKEKNPYASLAFLIHETRHSAQFQMAFGANRDLVFAPGYRAAFEAQKTLEHLSFCDFLTLLNEYEAFTFGNYVLGRLTGFSLDMIDMGTFASQYDENGKLKIDLAELSGKGGTAPLLEQFNELEKIQLDQLKARP